MRDAKSLFPLVAVPAVVMLAAALSAAGPGAPADDPEHLAEERAHGEKAFKNNCLMCHSEELSASQRLTAKQWQAEVDKMIGWGAPVPAELKAPLLAYLTHAYPEKGNGQPPGRATTAEVVAALRPEGAEDLNGDPRAGQTLYVKHCATCHGAEARGGELGTNLVEKPVLEREHDFTGVVRHGLRRMPGFSLLLKPAEERDVLAWLRGLRFRVPKP